MLTRCFRVLAPATALVLGAAALTGCTADRHTYSSTPMAPKSVDITYIQTGETAWSYDIPAGQKLTLEFTREGQFSGFKVPNTPAEEMSWYISGLGAGNDLSGHPGKFGSQESGSVSFTGEPIQINLRLRDPHTPDETPAPIEVVPAPPAFEEPEDVPAPPAMEVEEVEIPEVEVEAPETDMIETLEEAADDSADAMEEVAEDAMEAVEDTADELTK